MLSKGIVRRLHCDLPSSTSSCTGCRAIGVLHILSQDRRAILPHPPPPQPFFFFFFFFFFPRKDLCSENMQLHNADFTSLLDRVIT